MKRKPFHSILTVLLGVGAMGGIPCTAPLTYAAEIPVIENRASVIEDRGTTWWSVEELLNFNQEVEAEKDAECGDNQECRMEFGFSMYERGPKYSALSTFLDTQFWITSIDPTKEAIKVLFFDDDMMLRHMGIEEKLELEHLYIGWFEEWKGQIYNYDHDSFTNGTTPGSHPLYDSTVSDINEIIPWEEVELSVAGGGLADNPSGKLDYAIFAKYNMFNAQGHFDYTSCLIAPDYVDGMECQIMFSGDQGYSYFPPREQIIEPGPVETPEDPIDEPLEPEPTIEPVDEPLEPEPITEPTTDTPEPEPITNPTEAPGSEPESTAESPESDSTLSTEILFIQDNTLLEPQLSYQTTQAITINAPETGKSMKASEQSTEMPWWPTLIGAASLLFVIWWFLPSKNTKLRRKFEKKVRENQEKVLTNKTKCDKMSTV